MIKLQDIFIPAPAQPSYTLQQLFALQLQPRFLKEMAVQLNLSYLQNNPATGNVCFAHEQEVQPAFRTIFTQADIIHYVNAILQKDSFELDTDEVHFPENDITFWKLVKEGSVTSSK